ncbi:MAG: hypothetical protein EP343_22675 [Deltaproteobacteria bacterium]|nr:MAG: hypothetical protein EP343_22675 [Deltaproteobacteria bacterium]
MLTRTPLSCTFSQSDEGPRHQRSTKVLRCLLLLGALLVMGLSVTSCRDVSKLCQSYVNKYETCTKAAYERGAKLHKKLSAAAQKRSASMLAALKKKLYSPDWRTRQMKVCLKKPPSNQRFRCVKTTSCDTLSKCDPDATDLAPQNKGKEKIKK